MCFRASELIRSSRRMSVLRRASRPYLQSNEIKYSEFTPYHRHHCYGSYHRNRFVPESSFCCCGRDKQEHRKAVVRLLERRCQRKRGQSTRAELLRKHGLGQPKDNRLDIPKGLWRRRV